MSQIKTKKIFIACSVVLVSGILFVVNRESVGLKLLYEEVDLEREEIVEKVIVNISGEINKAGVYSVDTKHRIIDVINIAGGITDNGTTENINLADFVYDTQHIIIKNFKSLNIEDEIFDINKDKNEENNKKVNINTNDIDELKTLNGIGDTIARNIIEYRKKNGDFKEIEELQRVPRVGVKTFKKIRDNIVVNNGG